MPDRSEVDLASYPVGGDPRQGELERAVSPGLDAVDLSRDLAGDFMKYDHRSGKGIAPGQDLASDDGDYFFLCAQRIRSAQDEEADEWDGSRPEGWS